MMPLRAFPSLRLGLLLVLGMSLCPLPVLAAEPRLDRFGDPLPANVLLRLGTRRFRPGAAIKSLAFLPGDKVVISTGFRGIYFWDVATGKELRRISVSEDAVGSFALSEDGKLLAAVCDSRIRVWDVDSGRELRNLPGAAGCLAFSRDGRTLAHLDDQGSLYLWSWRQGKVRESILSRHHNVLGVRFSADDRTVWSWDYREMRSWDAGSGRLLRTLPYPREGGTYLDGMVLAPDGKVAARSLWRQPVRLFETATGREVGQFAAGELRAEAFTPDGRGLLLSPGGREGAALWDLARGKEVYRIASGGQPTFSHDGKILALASEAICLHDAATGKRIDPCVGQDYCSDTLVFSPDGRQLAGRSLQEGTVRLWKARTGKPLHVLGKPGVEEGCGSSLAFAADGTKLAWADWGGRVYLADPRRGETLRQWSVDQEINTVDSVAFSPDGRTLSTASRNAFGQPGPQLVQGWNAATGKEVSRQLRPPGPNSFPLLLSPDGAVVLLTEGDSVVLRDVRRGREGSHLHMPRRGDRIIWPLFSQDSRYLAAWLWTNPDLGVRVWEAASGMECAHLTLPQQQISNLALSPNGRLLACASPEAISLWDLPTGKEVATLRGHGLPVRSLAFSPDGKALASALSDTTVLLWDLTAYPQLAEVPAAKVDLEALWTDLASSDGGRAYRALWSLVGAGERSVRLLRQRLQAPVGKKRADLQRMIADLDSPEFAVRQAAFEQLKQHRFESEPLLRAALAGDPSVEARRSIERLLRLQQGQSLQELRQRRAVAVLEYQGTPQARQLLQTFAAGAPQALLPQEARAALGRLAHPR